MSVLTFLHGSQPGEQPKTKISHTANEIRPALVLKALHSAVQVINQQLRQKQTKSSLTSSQWGLAHTQQ